MEKHDFQFFAQLKRGKHMDKKQTWCNVHLCLRDIQPVTFAHA